MERSVLKDRVTIITGAGRGIGEALCDGFADEGATICPWDINKENLQRVADHLEKKNALGKKGIVDITDETQVENEINLIVEKFQRIDIMVSNAGILYSHEITDFPEQEWRRIIEVNLTGYFICAKYAAKVMKKQKKGVILQINSKSGKKGSYWNSGYASSKFGGIGLTQSIALDLAPFGIRVNAICPGNILESPLWQKSLFQQYAKKWGISVEEVKRKYVEQVPLGRPCTYRDVINVAIFLASDYADYMTGQAINVTGGQEMR
ncbi:MAG: Sorbitol-6-phosphate 2-dehydrogenase [candidate division TA06 bacterium ADurb.Bin131]|uniref:Sorbitol-6-phosphate 2-dehydrogenase n=1 Tax=candidate division TA06 bacterium ADurb.Bin131 TaxID=1852827 RepID=A0A1V6CCJ6_UNCT6|nr:MAG: Sorbitol-6-phosphate 2-dehydrogenase [candidate division TA06 bacterium ADurb.Bin131]HOC02742.1 sorbitol-6-phosphate dehydrogenase [bacterium]HON05513.1 sorbitol-6-phosphate dehydrogenase [bacterium]HPC28998.1 sorbitol-6-phosphate dehydrogenase [bacterium]HRV04084.1 sorbitol-6-phosphate dehydrogenase [Candidatus Ratteibacteria bacterium]